MRSVSPWWLLMAFGVAHCKPHAPASDTSLFPSCGAGAGVCLPGELLGARQISLLEQAGCELGAFCVPRELARGFIPETCTSVGGVEGRCLPMSLPSIAKQVATLPRSFCEEAERCAPCFDPFSGQPTGACELPGDPGAKLPVDVFETCCAAAGRCLPSTLVPAGQQALLGQASCESAELCVPEPLIDGPPPRCSSIAGAEGRCLSTCLPSVASERERLPISSCASAERCVPCFDPIDGEATGACELTGDPGPSTPKTTLGVCCGGRGRCLPPDLVAGDQVELLAADTCAAPDLCAPRTLVDGDAPRACSSLGAAEGRCLDLCLPLVAAQADRLPRASCAETQRCVPCFDPFSGEPTGACALTGDAGPIDAARRFERCCGGSGFCMPWDALDATQRASLGQEVCPESAFCAPEGLIMGVAPAACRSLGGFEGRCLPECLPLIAASPAELSQATCLAGERCAPCFDPLTGDPTGACSQAGDPGPAEPPGTFAACCGGAGSCLPEALVPETQRALLDGSVCAAQQLCTPRLLITQSAPVVCESVGGFEGRCLPECLPAVASQLDRLPRSICQIGQRCAPCSDPLTGTPTGACSLPGDPGPRRPHEQFAGCCSAAGAARGRCLPRELVPQDKQSLLTAQTCQVDLLCVPEALTASEGKLESCTASGNLGACVPSCMLSALQILNTSQGECQAWEKCVPCSIAGVRSGVCD